ncbi:LacI family DNA-binding transcriptional regulator [Pararhodonellum marinum]|uniref:LacI family DNA-binding transcriptional regulator n=1 Tax=Pararhodonellum marinum TaxID=2755358 RepID=UPI00188F32B5|nr:LacI family DNA-binding transcriptional regulator [Pararhodonellum marinum]
MTDKKKLTLKDIAKALNISISTVSRALKEHPDISNDTIKLVKAYAEEHHYVPNLLAVNFRQNKSYNIGLIIPELVHHFFSSVISGVIQTANQHGYNLMICQSNEKLEDEIKVANALFTSRVDGLLISLSNETDRFEHLFQFLEDDIPVVQFDKISDKLAVPSVTVDDFHGAYKAVSHMIQKGHRKIAHIRGRLIVQNASERCKGYEKALEDHGCEQHADWIKVGKDITEEEGYTYAKELMESDNPPNAFFCITDLVALGVMKYLKDHAFKIPEDVMVMGFSNWKMAEFVTPALSSVDQPGFLIGQKATELLLESIKNDESRMAKTVVLPTTLVIRASTG